MREWVAHDGRTYPVSDMYAEGVPEKAPFSIWARGIDPGIGKVWPSEEAARGIIAYVHSLGEDAGPEDIKRMECASNLINLFDKVRALQGRPLSDFGFETIDQVCRNKHTAPCGCVVQFVLDFHTREDIKGGERIHHPHFSKNVCDRHQHLAGDFKVHYDTVIAEYRSKPDA